MLYHIHTLQNGEPTNSGCMHAREREREILRDRRQLRFTIVDSLTAQAVSTTCGKLRCANWNSEIVYTHRLKMMKLINLRMNDALTRSRMMLLITNVVISHDISVTCVQSLQLMNNFSRCHCRPVSRYVAAYMNCSIKTSYAVVVSSTSCNRRLNISRLGKAAYCQTYSAGNTIRDIHFYTRISAATSDWRWLLCPDSWRPPFPGSSKVSFGPHRL